MTLLLAAPVRAEPVRMDLHEAVRRAEQHAPSLGPRRAAVRGSRGLVRAADQRLSLPPRVEVEVGPRFHGSAGGAGVDATVGVWQDLPLGGLGASRRRWAEAAGAEADARLAVAVQDARAQAALSWVDVRLAVELLRIRKESLVHAESIARVAAARVRAGSAPPSDEALAQAQVGRARAEVIEAEGRRFVAESALGHLTGARVHPIEVVGPLELPDGALAVREPAVLARAGQLDIAAADAARARSERAVEMAVAQGKPALSVGPSVTREATGDWIVLARASLPLPLASPTSLDTARARAEAEQQRAETLAQRRALELELHVVLHEREHARELRDALKQEVVAPAREALRQSLAQLEAGSADVASVLAARRELLAAEERWAHAAADVRRADIRLERLLAQASSGRARR